MDTTISSQHQVSSLSKKSYSLISWHRLRSVARAIAQTERNVAELKANINNTLLGDERALDSRVAVQSNLVMMVELEGEVKNARRRVLTLQSKLDRARNDKIQCDMDRRLFEADISLIKDALLERQRTYVGIREKLANVCKLLQYRQRQMISDLMHICQIKLGILPQQQHDGTIKGAASGNSYCSCSKPNFIVGIHLPDSDLLSGHNEMEMSAAFGIVGHLLTVLTRILDIQPRYTIKCASSRSMIADIIGPKLLNDDNIYPLFQRNQTLTAFEYGVYLLNMNIAQIRAYYNLSTVELHKTLPNINNLLLNVCTKQFDM